jgi:transposase-like protein
MSRLERGIAKLSSRHIARERRPCVTCGLAGIGACETDISFRERMVKEIGRATRKRCSAEEKIRVVLDALRGEYGIAGSLYRGWSKELLDIGKRRLASDVACAAAADEVKNLRWKPRALNEVVAGQTLELRLLEKKHDGRWGRRGMRHSASEKMEIVQWSSEWIG